jgi:hypothetical protein
MSKIIIEFNTNAKAEVVLRIISFLRKEPEISLTYDSEEEGEQE